MGNNAKIIAENKVQMENIFKIAPKIAAYMTGELTEEDRRELEYWKEESEENLQLFEYIVSEENKKRNQEEFHSFSTGIGWEEFRNKRMRRKLTIYSKWVVYAAIFILGVGIGFCLLFQKQPVSIPLSEVTYLPGAFKASLTLSSGKIIDLEECQGEINSDETIAVIRNEGNMLSYQDTFAVHKVTSAMVYNQVDVPQCGEYQLRLSDGSVVFLNSQTRLRFPVRFSGNTREVELVGEAYFEVTKDPDKPFIVHTHGQSITVLGTQFNVSAFENEEVIKTTLVTGKVRVGGKEMKEQVVLSPSEQLVFDKKSGQHKICRVDVQDYIAWKDGQFRFRDVRLDEIMRSIERWYGVEVEYTDPETKAYVFGLNFGRHETIEPLLRIFRQNGKIDIQTVGKKLKIRKGR